MGQSWPHRKEGMVSGTIEENSSLPSESNRRLVSPEEDREALKSPAYDHKATRPSLKPMLWTQRPD